jgi:hypothetical protein
MAMACNFRHLEGGYTEIRKVVIWGQLGQTVDKTLSQAIKSSIIPATREAKQEDHSPQAMLGMKVRLYSKNN